MFYFMPMLLDIELKWYMLICFGNRAVLHHVHGYPVRYDLET